MGRLIIVSNRVPSPRERSQPAGGLAVGLKDALRDGESLWFGWSGKQVQLHGGDPVPRLDRVDNVTYATIDLTPLQYEGFYQNFSNGILWPLFHYRVGLMNYSRTDWETYLAVNAMFARTLLPLLRPDDVIWVHDYHLFPLGQALRDLGCGAESVSSCISRSRHGAWCARCRGRTCCWRICRAMIWSGSRPPRTPRT